MRLALALAAVVALAAPAVAGAAAQVDVGDPPSQDLHPCDRSLRPCSDPIVLGVGRQFQGRVEIVGYQSRIGFCLAVDRRRSSTASCGGRAGAGRETIVANSVGTSTGGRHESTEVSGFLAPEVASVRARYFRDGRARKADAIVGRVDGPLLDAVRERKPFGVFAVVVRGCIEARGFRLVAYDAAGERIARGRLPRLSGICDEPLPPAPVPAP